MNYRVDHVLTEKQRVLRPLLAQQPGGEPRQLDRGGQRFRPTGNFLSASTTPSTSTTSGRCRSVAAQHAGELFAIPGAEHPPAPGILDPACLGFPSAATQYSGTNKYLPRFEMDDNSSAISGTRIPGGPTRAFIRSSRPGRCPRQSQLPVGKRHPRLSRGSFPSVHSAGRYDFGRGSASLFTKQLDNSPPRRSARIWRRCCSACRGRDHRTQHHPLQPGRSTAACSSRTTGR